MDWGEHDDPTWSVLPVLGEPGEYVTVFSDGSFAQWVPGQTGVAESEAVSWA